MDNCTADPWTLTTLGAIAERLVSGGTPPTENQGFWAGSMPWITGADFTHFGLTEFRRFVSEEAIERTATSVIDKGALLVVTRTGVGKLAIAPCDIAISQDITGVYPDQSQVDVEFLYHRMRQGVEDLRKLIQGTSINGIVRKDLSNYPLDLPPLTQQHQIAEILSTLDEAIEQTEALIAKQQRIKTGLMQDLLTRGIDEHGNLRSEQTHQFKDSPLGRIPVDWEVKELNDLVDEPITYGIVQAGPHIENGIPYIRTGDMAGEIIQVSQLLRTSPKIAKSYKRSSIYPGDIIFALRATVGKVLTVNEELSGANLTQGTAKISPRDSVDSIFLLWAMRTSQVQNAIRLEQKGTTFMEITLGDLRRIKLALPKEKHEQFVIGKQLELHERSRRNFLEQKRKLQSVKTALMQNLLTGERRVTKL